MKQNKLKKLELKLDELYGELVRLKFGEHSRLGVFIVDVDKISERIYELKALVKQILESEE